MLHTRLGDEHRLKIVGRYQTARSLSSGYENIVTATSITSTATVPPHSLGRRQLRRDLTTWLKGANRWLPMFRFVTFRFVFRYVLFGDESDKMAV